ncbi:dual specificity phosphatase [Aspergillus taichungensis]|uniref:protein-tyrosine-phosphatase n=1 Tax=Aspergillus taichungensis TaxID=482145 RepID=A0A2J5HLY2_9EURO|nr:dual specificity phosphatase [Aspergillus taichungensis]
MAMNQIPGHNIYIGGIFTLRNKAALTRANITHIVSVIKLRPDESVFEGFQQHRIDVDDVDDENLLEHFPATTRFIQSGLDAGGSVLVHCAMGKSRSATIAIAYLLNRQPNVLSPESALDLIRQSRPLCEPNDGFMRQLFLYHQMGCPDDVVNHPTYIRWLSNREVEESVACGRAPEMKSVLFEDERTSEQQASADRATEIKCRKCRRTLATGSFIAPHGPQGRADVKTDCAHIFLHPLTWMRPCLFPNEAENENASEAPSEDAPLSGRLTCPNSVCGQNIGKFAWQGMQCSCGDWVVPAIAVVKARVDVSQRVTTARGPAALGIRMPPGMRPSGPPQAGSGRGNL